MTKKRYETFVNGISGKKVVIKCSKTMQVSKKEFDYFLIDQMGFEIDTYYEERLIEKDLINKAIYIKSYCGWVSKCIPCGKNRVSGMFDLNNGSLFNKKDTIEILRNNNGFPNPRIESYPAGDGRILNFLIWGKTPRARDSFGNVLYRELGEDLGYRHDAIDEFCKMMEQRASVSYAEG